MACEFGLTPKEARKLTLAEFDLMMIGYHHRQEKEINRTRSLMAAFMNMAGKVLNQSVTPQQLWPLDMDRQSQKRMIMNMADAMKLLKEYK